MNILNFLFLQEGSDIMNAAADSLANNSANEQLDVMDIIVQSNSWYILIPLLLMSLYAVYVFVERFMALRRANSEEKEFMLKIKDYVQDGKLDAATNLCATTDNPIARMVEKGISRIGKPMSDITVTIENVGKLEIYRLENKLSSLATISGVAPMIGFLGTVLGMIVVFSRMKGGFNIEDLSEGIMMAMVTTVAGLIVGILAYVMYNFLVAKVGKAVQNMEATSIEFIDILEAPGK